MKNTLKFDHAKRTIVMDRTFAKFAANTMSQEFVAYIIPRIFEMCKLK